MGLNILILSSYGKSYSGNLVQDRINALESEGHNVTWGYEGFDKQIEYVHNKHQEYLEKRKKYKYIYGIFYKIEQILGGIKKWHYFSVKNEFNPKLISPLNIDKIKGEYDLIYIFFTTFMISAKTINDLYIKFKCPIVLAGIDMYHLTGGCIFTDNCKKYSDECKNCPSLNYFNRNRAYKNFTYKKYIYNKCNVIYTCNSWQKRAVDECKMFDDDHTVLTSYMLDEAFFTPKNKKTCRLSLGIGDEFSLVFLARYETEKRKGFEYLITAINTIYSKVPLVERKKTLLLTVGKQSNTLQQDICIPVIQLGKISIDNLVTAYNAADLFISPSIDDAGPSMVNQSMACGTPVLTFELGTAIDVVKEGKSGFMADLKSQEDFTKKLNQYVNLSAQEKALMCIHAREIAMIYNSRKAFIDRTINIYEKFHNLCK